MRCEHIYAQHAHLPRSWSLQAGDCAQQDGFTGARSANNAEDLSGMNIQIKVVVDDLRAELIAQTAYFDDIFVGSVVHRPRT